MTAARVVVQGIEIDAIDVGQLLDRVGELVRAGRRSTVAYVNVHVLNVAAETPTLTTFLRTADICYNDGKGVVLGARILGSHLPGRMTGADWIWEFAERAAREGWRVAWIGGEYGVTASAARVLQARYPSLQVVLAEHGYFRREHAQEDSLLAKISAASPDVVLVGLGTPAQESWVARVRQRIDAPVVWCLGATADFVSGKVHRGPAFLYRNHEWLARLLADPKRLWRRYLIGNPRFVARLIRERRRREREIR